MTTQTNRLITLQRLWEIGNFGFWRIRMRKGLYYAESSVMANSIVSDHAEEVSEPLDVYLKRCHPLDVDRVTKALEQMLRHPGNPYRMQCRVWNAGMGQWRWVQSFGESYLDDEGFSAMDGTVQDITDGVAFQTSMAERREAEERMRIMLDTTPLCCNFWDEDCRNIDCNQAAVNLFDLPDKKTYLDRFMELSPELQPDGTRSVDRIPELILDGFRLGQLSFEWMHQMLDGTPIPTEVTLVRARYGERYMVAGYTRDLRALKATEAERDLERNMILQVLSSSPVSFNILVDGEVRFITPFCRSFLGIEIGDRMDDYLVYPEDSARMNAVLDRGETVDWWPLQIRTRDGQVKHMLVNLFGTDYYGERGVMQWLVDVTEIRKAEAELRIARDAAQQSARAKSEFLANMSHEIRTPMNAIMGLNRLVLRTDLSEQQRDYLNKIEQASESLMHIINDLLDFSCIESGDMRMDEVRFSLPNVIERAEEQAHKQTVGRDLCIRSQIDPSAQVILKGDPARLEQILEHLMSNAIKFTEEGEICLSVREHMHDVRGVTMLFSVKDSGIGMSSDIAQSLFMPFTQADSSVTRKYGGTGLGLALCKDLVNMMHGEIWCVSKPNMGSTFYFTIPFTLEERIAQKEEPAPPLPKKMGVGYRILLTEDNEINQMVAQELLQIAGFAVDIASNGLEALEKLEKKHYDMVLMDIQMPEMDGLTATKAIRKRPPLAQLPIIAMTAHALEEDREKSLRAGMNDHITKPIDPETMYQTIAKWLPGCAC